MTPVQPGEAPPVRSQVNERRADGSRRAGWREVLLIAAVVLVIVFVVEFATSESPALQDLFLHTPFTIVVLVAGTLGVLGLVALRRNRPLD